MEYDAAMMVVLHRAVFVVRRVGGRPFLVMVITIIYFVHPDNYLTGVLRQYAGLQSREDCNDQKE